MCFLNNIQSSTFSTKQDQNPNGKKKERAPKFPLRREMNGKDLKKEESEEERKGIPEIWKHNHDGVGWVGYNPQQYKNN